MKLGTAEGGTWSMKFPECPGRGIPWSDAGIIGHRVIAQINLAWNQYRPRIPEKRDYTKSLFHRIPRMSP